MLKLCPALVAILDFVMDKKNTNIVKGHERTISTM
jgi:hypothetical protein